jgi:hypothetical protein
MYIQYIYINHIYHNPFWDISTNQQHQALNVVAFCYREIASMLRTQWEERIIDQRLGQTWRTWIGFAGKVYRKS